MLRIHAPASDTDGRYRANICLRQEVEIVTKRDQKTGRLTRGRVRWILTSKAYHSRGIKVMLDDRSVGRVQRLIAPDAVDSQHG